MKVLVLDQNAADLQLVSGFLRDLGHEIRTAASRKDAIALLSQGQPQLVIVDAVHSDSGGIEFVRLLRGLETPSYMYILMLTGDVGEGQLLSGYEAGVDNHARKPVARDHLAARLRAAERVLGATAQPGADSARSGREPAVAIVKSSGAAPANGQSGQPAAAGRPAAAKPAVSIGGGRSAPVDMVAGSGAWKSAPAALHAVSGEFFPVPIAISDRTTPSVAPSLSSCISLANVQQQIELRVMIAAGEASARALAMHLFGEDNLELATDMLSELANQLMGSLKSSFAKDGVSFTGGIPKRTELDRFARWQSRCEHNHGFLLQADGAELIVRLGLRAKLNIVVPVSRLREDMVIAKDIVNANGIMLLPGGTRLSQTMAERVRRMLPNGQVELMDPDDVLDYLSDHPSS